MMIWSLAVKDLKLLARDRRALVVLLLMPLLFICVLGVSLGEGFGQKPDDRLRVCVVDLDRGYDEPAAISRHLARLAGTPGTPPLATAAFATAAREAGVPEPWSRIVLRDLSQTSSIRVEMIPSREEASYLVQNNKRAAVLVFGPQFSLRVDRCSFLADGINPFFRDGVNLSELDVEMLTDKTQLTASSIIEQVAQVTLLRVLLPWMIGKAFDRLSDPSFIDRLAEEVRVPVPMMGKVQLKKLLTLPEYKKAVGEGVQRSLSGQFPKYNLTGKTWADLTKSDSRLEGGAKVDPYEPEHGGLLKRGRKRYQLLVPAYTVMFAFFLVLSVGWLFVAERRQGTLKRLRAAPLHRYQLLLGKLIPCYLLSLFQGFFLLLCGKLVFGMSWGSDPQWLIPVVAATSLAALGLSLLVAVVAQTETQVAVYGTLIVLILAGLSGCLMGDREFMPEVMQKISLITPHAWALTAYKQLLSNPSSPNLHLVGQACAVLAGFGVILTAAAWRLLEWKE